jgi:hypothetical protein
VVIVFIGDIEGIVILKGRMRFQGSSRQLLVGSGALWVDRYLMCLLRQSLFMHLLHSPLPC